MPSYTERTLTWLRDEGFDPWIVERRVGATRAGYGVSRDLFNLVDIVALGPFGQVWVQSTGPNGHAAHRRDMLANPYLARAYVLGVPVLLVSWRKLLVKRGGKSRKWVARVEEMRPSFEDAAAARSELRRIAIAGFLGLDPKTEPGAWNGESSSSAAQPARRP